jgi:hypothetical protein
LRIAIIGAPSGAEAESIAISIIGALEAKADLELKLLDAGKICLPPL